MGVVLISHDIQTIFAIADHIVVLRLGAVIFDDAVGSIDRTPARAPDGWLGAHRRRRGARPPRWHSVIDAHVHVFKELSDAYPRDVAPLFPSSHAARIEDLLTTMDSHAVEGAILVPLSGHDRYVCECVRNWPDRFRAILVHDPLDPGDLRESADESNRLEPQASACSI